MFHAIRLVTSEACHVIGHVTSEAGHVIGHVTIGPWEGRCHVIHHVTRYVERLVPYTVEYRTMQNSELLTKYFQPWRLAWI